MYQIDETKCSQSKGLGGEGNSYTLPGKHDENFGPLVLVWEGTMIEENSDKSHGTLYDKKGE